MGQLIKRKSFKTVEEAEAHRLELCNQLGTQNISMSTTRNRDVESRGYTSFSYLNLDMQSKQGLNFKAGYKRELSRMEQLYPNKLEKRKKAPLFDLNYDYSKLPKGQSNQLWSTNMQTASKSHRLQQTALKSA